MLQLEDRRVSPHRITSPRTCDDAGRSRPETADARSGTRRAASQDLTVLVTDPEARVRRRAAMAIGRVGLREGIQPLTVALGDSDPDVREMAAFALGLIGHGTRQPL